MGSTKSKPTTSKPRTIDEYLAGASEDHRRLCQRLRKTILSAAPDAEECISYGLAAFRLNGRALVAFGAWENHCALYPMSAATVRLFQPQLKEFETTKGTIRFTSENPLPATLVKKLVKARVAENRSRV